MNPMSSVLATDTAIFQRRRDACMSMMAALQARREEASLGGNEKARKLHKGRGQMLPRERIAALLDPGSPS